MRADPVEVAMDADTLLNQAIADILASDPPVVGSTVASEGMDRAVTLISVVAGIATLRDADCVEISVPVTEIFDVNQVRRRALQLQAKATMFSTN